MTSTIEIRAEDGRFVDREGQPVEKIKIRIGESVTLIYSGTGSVWAHVDDSVKSDFTWTATNETPPRLPPLAVFHGLPLPTEAGNVLGHSCSDLTGATVSTIGTVRPPSPESEPNVAVTADGDQVRVSIEQNVDGYFRVRYVDGAPVPGSAVRVKHRLAEWSSNDGQKLKLAPKANVVHKKCWIHLHDGSVEPIEVAVVSGQSNAQSEIVSRALPEHLHGGNLQKFLETHVSASTTVGSPFDLLETSAADRDLLIAEEDVLVSKIRTLLPDIVPEQVVADARLVVSSSGEFSDARGTASSIAHAARSVTGSSATRRWTSDELMRGSDSGALSQEHGVFLTLADAAEKIPGVWEKTKGSYGSVLVDENVVDVESLAGHALVGQENDGEAVIELAETRTMGTHGVVVLVLSGRHGSFRHGEIVHVVDGSQNVVTRMVLHHVVVGFEKISGAHTAGDVFFCPSTTWVGRTQTHTSWPTRAITVASGPVVETSGLGIGTTSSVVCETKGLVAGQRVTTATWRPILSPLLKVLTDDVRANSCVSHDSVVLRSDRKREGLALIESESDVEAVRQTVGQALLPLGTDRVHVHTEAVGVSSLLMGVSSTARQKGAQSFYCGDFTTFQDFDLYVDGQKIRETDLTFDEVPFDEFDPYESNRRTYVRIPEPLVQRSMVTVTKRSVQYYFADEPPETLSIVAYDSIEETQNSVPSAIAEPERAWLISQLTPDVPHTFVKIQSSQVLTRAMTLDALVIDQSGKTAWIDAHAPTENGTSTWVAFAEPQTGFCPISTTQLTVRQR